MRKSLMLSLVLLGCAGTTVRSLGEDFIVVKGILVAPPTFDTSKERLFLYIKSENLSEGKEEIVTAVAENTESKKILQDLADKLTAAPNEVTYVYGVKNKGPWNEYVTGIDFVVVAVGVFVEPTKTYQIVLTDYGERGRDALKNASWGGFMRLIGKAAMKAL